MLRLNLSSADAWRPNRESISIFDIFASPTLWNAGLLTSFIVTLFYQDAKTTSRKLFYDDARVQPLDMLHVPPHLYLVCAFAITFELILIYLKIILEIHNF